VPRVVPALALVALTAACVGPGTAPEPTPESTPAPTASPTTTTTLPAATTTTPTTSPTTTIQAATTTVPTTSSFGGDRPVGILGDPTAGATLLVLLHGFGDSGAGMAGAWGEAALDAGMVVLAPDGTEVRGLRFWNATSACCDFAGTGVDDVGYLADLIDEVRTTYDLGEVAVLGFSNGAFMAHRLACERSDTVDAIVAIAGALDADLDACDPDAPVRVLSVHGDLDPVVRYAGVAPGEAPPPLNAGHPGAVETIRHWASVLGCGTEQAGDELDLEVGGEDETVPLRFEGCEAGSGAELWTVRGADHGIAFTGDGRRLVIDWISSG